MKINSVVHDKGCYFRISTFNIIFVLNCKFKCYRIKRVFVVVLNVTGYDLWVCSNDPLVDSGIAYIHGGARANVRCETNFLVILCDSKTDIN